MRTTAPPTGLEAVSVMIIDDSRTMRELLMALLQGFGISTMSQASDGADALRKLSEAKPDIVFVDWSMEGLDGAGFVRAIRRDEGNPMRHVPIVMITGHAELDRVTEARDAGINEFMVKPITGKALAARLETLIHRPRPFARTSTYYGPDRRRKSEAYEGDERRRASKAAKTQATLDATDIQALLGEDADIILKPL